MDKRQQTCCFTGHRQIPDSHTARLEKTLETTLCSLIQQGVIYYGAGGALGFDTLAALTVLRLREKFPQIRLILVLPYPQQDQYWNPQQQQIYRQILSRADKVIYLAPRYTPACMHQRNRHLVEHSGVCVAYATKFTGGTAYTVSYAAKKGVPVINLAEKL